MKNAGLCKECLFSNQIQTNQKILEKKKRISCRIRTLQHTSYFFRAVETFLIDKFDRLNWNPHFVKKKSFKKIKSFVGIFVLFLHSSAKNSSSISFGCVRRKAKIKKKKAFSQTRRNNQRHRDFMRFRRLLFALVRVSVGLWFVSFSPFFFSRFGFSFFSCSRRKLQIPHFSKRFQFRFDRHWGHCLFNVLSVTLLSRRFHR